MKHLTLFILLLAGFSCFAQNPNNTLIRFSNTGSIPPPLTGTVVVKQGVVRYYNPVSAGYNAKADSLFSWMIPTPPDSIKTLLNNLVTSLSAYGTWDSLDNYTMLAAATPQHARLNFIKHDSATIVGTPIFIPFLGYYTKNNGYINTNYNPTSNAVKYKINNASFGFYVYNDTVQAKIDFGARSTSGTITRTSAHLSDKNASFTINNRTRGLNALSDNKGLYSVSLTGDTVKTYADGKYNLNLTTGTSVLDNLNLYLGCYNLDGTASNFAIRKYQYYYIGGGLRDWHHKIIYSASQDYLEAVGNAAYIRTTQYNIVCDGNSLTKGTAGCNSGFKAYPTLLADSLTDELAIHNNGIDSQTDSMMYNNDTDVEQDWSHLTKNNILIYWEGTNSIARDSISPAKVLEWTRLYCLKQRKRGFKIIVLSTLPRGSTPYLSTNLNAVNSLLSANWSQFSDGYIDVRSDNRLSDNTNTTYFCNDLIHLNEAGYAVIAQLVKAKINQMKLSGILK
jgi:lysophospholipase L1-like esterase